MVEEDTEFVTFDGISITKSDYREEIIDQYVDDYNNNYTQVNDFNVGSEAYHLADIMASLMLESREGIDNNYRMTMIHYMEGEFLDQKGDEYGVHRKPAYVSEGNVTFTLSTPRTENDGALEIPAGTIIATEDSISFTTDEDTLIEVGNTTATVSATSEDVGEYTNVLPNTINLILSDLNVNNLTVTNNEEFTGGQDIEEDDDYRQRLLMAPSRYPVGTLRWFETIIFEDENINNLIHDVYAKKREEGEDWDIKLYFNPNNKNETDITCNGQFNLEVTCTPSECSLRQFFAVSTYNVAGLKLAYEKAGIIEVLHNETLSKDGVTYSIIYMVALVLIGDLELTQTIRDKVYTVIEEFNKEAVIGSNFNPNNLAVLIEENVEEVETCKIIQRARNNTTGEYSYGEVTSEISVGRTNIYQVISNLNISKMTFVPQVIEE